MWKISRPKTRAKLNPAGFVSTFCNEAASKAALLGWAGDRTQSLFSGQLGHHTGLTGHSGGRKENVKLSLCNWWTPCLLWQLYAWLHGSREGLVQSHSCCWKFTLHMEQFGEQAERQRGSLAMTFGSCGQHLHYICLWVKQTKYSFWLTCKANLERAQPNLPSSKHGGQTECVWVKLPGQEQAQKRRQVGKTDRCVWLLKQRLKTPSLQVFLGSSCRCVRYYLTGLILHCVLSECTEYQREQSVSECVYVCERRGKDIAYIILIF